MYNFWILVDVGVRLYEEEQNRLCLRLQEKEKEEYERIFSHFPRKKRSSLVNKFVTSSRNPQQIHGASSSSSNPPNPNFESSLSSCITEKKSRMKHSVEERKRNVQANKAKEEAIRLNEEEHIRLRRQEKGKAICDSEEESDERLLSLNGASTSSSSKRIDLNMIPDDDSDTEEEPQIPLQWRASSSSNPPNPNPESSSSSCRKRRAVQDIKRSVKAKKAKVPPLSWRGKETPERLLQLMSDMNGSDPRLIFEKTLTKTDIDQDQSRLLMPFSGLICDDFLTEVELGIVQEDSGNDENKGVGSILIDLRNVKWGVIFKRRDMKKKTGRGTMNYALISGWSDMVLDSGLQEGDVISLWSFRWCGILCFVILPPPTE